LVINFSWWKIKNVKKKRNCYKKSKRISRITKSSIKFYWRRVRKSKIIKEKINFNKILFRLFLEIFISKKIILILFFIIEIIKYILKRILICFHYYLIILFNSFFWKKIKDLRRYSWMEKNSYLSWLWFAITQKRKNNLKINRFFEIKSSFYWIWKIDCWLWIV
jgi:hypothetical protein